MNDGIRTPFLAIRLSAIADPGPQLPPSSSLDLCVITNPGQLLWSPRSLTVEEVGVLAGLAEMWALETTQHFKGAWSSCMAGANLSMARAELLPESPLCALSVLCSKGHWGFL